MEYYNLEVDLVAMGERIKKERTRMGVTRDQLAETIGVTPKFIADIETGNRGVSIRNLLIISKYFGVSADYLLVGKREEPAEAAERRRLKESILAPLDDCDLATLRLMERLSRVYLDGMRRSKIGL